MRLFSLTLAAAAIVTAPAFARPTFELGPRQEIERTQDWAPRLDSMASGDGRFATLSRRSQVPADNPFPPTRVDTTLFLQMFDRRGRTDSPHAAVVHPPDANVGDALVAISRSGRVAAVIWVEYAREAPGLSLQLQAFSTRDGRKLSRAREILSVDTSADLRLVALEPRRGGFWVVTAGAAHEIRPLDTIGRPGGDPIPYASGPSTALASASRDGGRLLVASRPFAPPDRARWTFRIVSGAGATVATGSTAPTGDGVSDIAPRPDGSWSTAWGGEGEGISTGPLLLRSISPKARLGPRVVAYEGGYSALAIAHLADGRGVLAWQGGQRPCPDTLHVRALDRSGRPASPVEAPLLGRSRACRFHQLTVAPGTDGRFLAGWLHIGYVPNSPKYDYRIEAAPLRFTR